MNLAEQFKGWMPIRIHWQESEPSVDWCNVGDCRFTESFFDQTIERMLRNPYRLMFRQLTSIETLEKCASEIESIPPTGFIFHLSRCGSTLVSQMLASLEQNVVVSEASTLDWMIRANVRRPDICNEERINWIKWMVTALGQKRTENTNHLFIKFDSWHTFDLDLILRAFPDVPWIFLYRHPTEVMVSHIKQRGAGTVPGMIEHRIGYGIEESLQMSPEEYVARVLARICESALKFSSDRNGIFVNYSQLPEFVGSDLLSHFRLDYSDEEIETIKAAARFNSKTPSLEFKSDVEEKQKAADENARQISEELLMPLYESLEAVRMGLK